jgi:exodeoxyribonuclease VII small subunit
MADEHELDAEPSFEQALSELERIVASLERGEPELTSALAKYEKGVGLLAQCYRLIEQAELSIALITGVDDAGSPLTTPYDATPTIAREGDATATSHPQGLSLQSNKRNVLERPTGGKTHAPTPDNSDDPPF